MPPEEKHRRNTEIIVKDIHSSEERVVKCKTEFLFSLPLSAVVSEVSRVGQFWS